MARGKWSLTSLVWLSPVGMLLAVGAGAWLARSPPEYLLGVVLGTILVLALGWIAASVLWPARADRTCPACKKTTIERIDEDETHGIHCTACGWRDETTSSWLLAEEEGPLEEVVLAERSRRRAARGRAAQ
jgi:Zn ribbon nucleic-acid-binding protein